MTDSELLDRRIENLVVSTVHRELRRIEEQRERVNEHTCDAIAYAAYDTPGLTVAVLQSELRRSSDRCSEYARELQKLRSEHVELKSRHETQSNTLQRKVKRLNELVETCIRLTQERDGAQSESRARIQLIHRQDAELEKLRAAYHEVTGS